MARVLVTGMSGTGKSTALAELGRRGIRVVETDEPPWSEWSEADGGYVWREDLVAELLAGDDGPTLYVSGTVSNQGRFYDRFDAVVLLSAPAEVLLRANRVADDERLRQVRPRNASSSSSTSPRSSRCSVQPARTRSTRHSRSPRSSRSSSTIGRG